MAQCGARGTAFLVEATQKNDDDALVLSVSLTEAYELKKTQVQNSAYMENEYKNSIEILTRNKSAYTDMCKQILNEISMAHK